jgi:hypothetical protein
MSTIEQRPSRRLADANARACADERQRDGDHGGDGASTGYRIAGVTGDGKPFRPGDWADRLAGVITLFVKEKRPSSGVAATWLAVPFVQGGVRCLSVSPQLAQVCPEAFDFLMRFARDNELVVEGGAADEADA